MLGQHPTPPELVRWMLRATRLATVVKSGGRVLDAGCGEGAFLLPALSAYLKHASASSNDMTWVSDRVRGIEVDESKIQLARHAAADVIRAAGFRPTPAHLRKIVRHGDFLAFEEGDWDLVVGNPPYVRIEGISDRDRNRYRRTFRSATNRFDLYFLFFEQALRIVRPGGRVCFVTPQKFMQVGSGQALRSLMAVRTIERVRVLDEGAFEGLVTYPVVTLLRNDPPGQRHEITIESDRLGLTTRIPQRELRKGAWSRVFTGNASTAPETSAVTLRDVCTRIGVGVATGRDDLYIFYARESKVLPQGLLWPVVAGRQLPNEAGQPIETDRVMLVPYDEEGRLLPPKKLGDALKYLSMPHVKAELEKRTCVKNGKRPWYAFHETPRPSELRAPKILTQDIQKEPRFHLDYAGLLPRHSVYYLVPKQGVDIETLAAYLNSEEARTWITSHAQHAANGHFRIQSSTLADLPVPRALARELRLAPTQSTLAVSA